MLALGGVQVAGPSNDVWIVENEIEGGNRNGVTLGNLLYLDANGAGDGRLVGLLTEAEDACSAGASGSIPGTTTVGTVTTPVAAGGVIRCLHILRNRICGVGMCGVGPVGFFDLNKTDEIVSLENVLIAENIMVNTLSRNVLAAPISASPYGYGVISLPDVLNLTIRDNMISNYGVEPGAEVCGIYVHHGEGIEIDGNQIRESRDLSGSRPVKWTNYGGKRGGIYIDLATPPPLDISADSAWNQSIKDVYASNAGDAFYYQPPRYAPGFSALRIENNTVRTAFGLALYAVGTGPFSILGNHFGAGGAVALDSAELKDFDLSSPNLAAVGTGLGALTVSIMNLGLALEASDLIESYRDLSAANDSFFPGGLANDLSVTNGTVLFSNNICQLMAQLNSARGLASVAILTLDHLMFANNQLWINGPARTAGVDALLLGVSVQAIANRLQELTNAVLDLGFSFGVMNVTSQNVSTYCFLSFGAKPQWRILAPNVAFNYARCERGYLFAN